MGRGGSLLAIMDFLVGGDEVEFDAGDECEGEEPASLPGGRGAMGIATSTVLLYAGNPSHCLPDLTHFVHCGRVSSHFTRRFLQKFNQPMHDEAHAQRRYRQEEWSLTCNYCILS